NADINRAQHRQTRKQSKQRKHWNSKIFSFIHFVALYSYGVGSAAGGGCRRPGRPGLRMVRFPFLSILNLLPSFVVIICEPSGRVCILTPPGITLTFGRRCRFCLSRSGGTGVSGGSSSLCPRTSTSTRGSSVFSGLGAFFGSSLRAVFSVFFGVAVACSLCAGAVAAGDGEGISVAGPPNGVGLSDVICCAAGSLCFFNAKKPTALQTSTNTTPNIAMGTSRPGPPPLFGRTTVVSPVGPTVCALATVCVCTGTVFGGGAGNKTVCASPRFTTVEACSASCSAR